MSRLSRLLLVTVASSRRRRQNMTGLVHTVGSAQYRLASFVLVETDTKHPRSALTYPNVL